MSLASSRILVVELEVIKEFWSAVGVLVGLMLAFILVSDLELWVSSSIRLI